jgi:hypothetical protein
MFRDENPQSQWTKEDSGLLANDWWRAKKQELDGTPGERQFDAITLRAVGESHISNKDSQ